MSASHSTQSAIAHSNAEGLTDLHLAVLKDDTARVYALIDSREVGPDARTPEGATALMLTCLYGREGAFFALLDEKSIEKKDCQGFSAFEYAKHLPFTQAILAKYEGIAKSPDRDGSKIRLVMRVLRRYEKQNRRNYENSASALKPTPSIAPVPNPTPESSISPERTVFLRKGNKIEICRVRCVTSAQFEQLDFGRNNKVAAAIRGKNETSFQMLTVSGWGGDRALTPGIICNRAYSGLVRRICDLYNVKLSNNWLDCRWTGDPSDKDGSYNSCHGEKQLAAWALEKCLSHATGSAAITTNNVAQLKDKINTLPIEFRQMVIELDHKPCQSCTDFLNLVENIAGIEIKCISRDRFVPGLPSRYRRLDGRHTYASGPQSFEDEVGDSDTLGDTDTEVIESMGNQDQSSSASVEQPIRPARRSQKVRRNKIPKSNYRKGKSPIYEDPSGNSSSPGTTSPYQTGPINKSVESAVRLRCEVNEVDESEHSDELDDLDESEHSDGLDEPGETGSPNERDEMDVDMTASLDFEIVLPTRQPFPGANDMAGSFSEDEGWIL